MDVRVTGAPRRHREWLSSTDQRLHRIKPLFQHAVQPSAKTKSHTTSRKKGIISEKLDEFQSAYNDNKRVYNECIPLRDSVRAVLGPSMEADQILTHATDLSEVSNAVLALLALKRPSQPLLVAEPTTQPKQ